MTLTAVFESLEDMMDFAKVMVGNAGSEPVPMQSQTTGSLKAAGRSSRKSLQRTKTSLRIQMRQLQNPRSL